MPKTAEKKGMIIELKCENKNAQSGNAMETPMGTDINKRYKIKPEYQDHQFVALAMAYTPKADEALARIGMRPIPGAAAAIVGHGTMKAYKEAMTLGSLSKDMQELEDAFKGLFSPVPGSPPTRPKTPPTTGPGKTPPPASPKTPPPAPKKPTSGKTPPPASPKTPQPAPKKPTAGKKPTGSP